MNFKPELAAKVMDGSKTVTRRLVSDNPNSPWWREKCGYVVGQDVAICPGRGKHAIGRAWITSVQRQPLGAIDDREAIREGFGGRQVGPYACDSQPSLAPRHAFRAAWTTINGSYDPAAIVWRIGLERITE